MKVITDRTTVVLVGAFNPAILQPNWIAVHGLGYAPEQEFQVEILSPVGGVGPNRFSFDGLSYSAGYRNVTLHLEGSTPEQCARAATATAKVLELLPHTPVNGLGFNFGFSVDEPSNDLLALLSQHDALLDSFGAEAEVATRRWGNTLKWQDALVSVDCEMAGHQLVIQLNFHYGTASASEARAILQRDNVVEAHRTQAIASARALTGENLET